MMNKFKIHPFYYLVASLSILNGFFKDFMFITIIIFIHEIGHILGAVIYKWKIEKIVILPFGGITIFNELLNRRIFEELIIVILGPLFQIVFTYIININIKLNNNLFLYYSNIILIFNLLPIIPLDGSKLFNLFTDYLFPYKKSYLITLYNSFILLFIFLIYTIFNFNLIILLMIIFLSIKNIKEYNNRNYRFNKFILERMNYNLIFNKCIVINNINKIKRDYRHIFKINDKQYTEHEFLFDKQRKIC